MRNEGAEKTAQERKDVDVVSDFPKLLTDILRLPDSAGRGSHDRPFISRSQTQPQPGDNLTSHHVPSRLLSDSRNPQTGKLHPRCTPFYFSVRCHLFTTPQTAKRWSGSLGVWGVGAGTALVFVRPSPHFSYTALSEPPPFFASSSL